MSGAYLGGKGFGDPVTFDNAYYTSLLAKPWLNPNDPMADMIGASARSPGFAKRY